MTPDVTSQITAGLLILWLTSLLTVGLLIGFGVAIVIKGRAKKQKETADPVIEFIPPKTFLPSVFDSACRWLVVPAAKADAVQSALRIHNPQPCSWDEGLAALSNDRLFISPPINGWVLVIGQALADPMDDVDACYRLIRRLGAKFGSVQFFSFNRAVNHHAWVRTHRDRIVRAYAWSGETLWDEGKLTPAEKELDVVCLPYAERVEPNLFAPQHPIQSNIDKLLLLAARWSIDPTAVDERAIASGKGISGSVFH